MPRGPRVGGERHPGNECAWIAELQVRKRVRIKERAVDIIVLVEQITHQPEQRDVLCHLVGRVQVYGPIGRCFRVLIGLVADQPLAAYDINVGADFPRVGDPVFSVGLEAEIRGIPVRWSPGMTLIVPVTGSANGVFGDDSVSVLRNVAST